MTLDIQHRSKLLALARQSIDSGLKAMRWIAMPHEELPTSLSETRSSFVTLRVGKRLRGSSGNVTASLPLAEDVWHNAWAAAFADPRFEPLDAEELEELRIHISIVSPLEELAIAGESELVATLRPNVDGLVLQRDEARATFLPEVWELISDPRDFVRHLKEKAGWPGNAWSPLIKAQRFTAENLEEPEVANREFKISQRFTAA